MKLRSRSSQSPAAGLDPVKIALAFVGRINAKDVDGLCALMTKNHRFVDSMGDLHAGRERMREGWRRYLALFPDYRVTVTHTFSAGARAALFGSTRARYAPSGRLVAMRAAWLVTVRGRLVAEWRVFADNEPARRAMRE